MTANNDWLETRLSPIQSAVVVFLDDPSIHSKISASLSESKFIPILVDSAQAALRAIQESHAFLLVVSHCARGEANCDLREELKVRGILTLAIVEDPRDAQKLACETAAFDDWVLKSNLAIELPARVTRLFRQRNSSLAAASHSSPPDDHASNWPAAPLLPLIIHDLRTPLNVFGLSLSMLRKSFPRLGPEIEEDIIFMEENFRLLELMLKQLSDYHRLMQNGCIMNPSRFSPERAVEELIDGISSPPGVHRELPHVDLEVDQSCPLEAELDPIWTRLALQYALTNTTAAAGTDPIRLSLRGYDERIIIEFSVDRPPPRSVKSEILTPYSVTRICGISAERRGMDLAIVAKISELFGGSVSLVAVPNHGTTLVIDWPTQITTGGSATNRNERDHAVVSTTSSV